MENCRQILQHGLQELNIAFDDSKLDSLLAFIKLIEKWNKAYNLTAVRQPEDMARLHILDSLAILPFVQQSRVADIGTGAGLPGIPLAIFLPDVEFTLIDSNSKKTRFVQQAILELKLNNVKVIHSRVENLQPETPFSTVIMRAFSSLQDIMNLTRHLIDKKGILLAMKGQQPEQELAEIKTPYSIIPIQVPGVEAERCLIRIERMTENG
ncbi:MAG: 16S rRNA (guanine(527)-N(7))-methyltransferase RsmG [Methylococcales bacterium]|nr:16S rRNA (guanine(527)-N(7))-methyltransferase RsmG [Methylococcales bacterium]MCK5478905.1 16S rRNA (guanine(527)-N(7))-methyltransferase RsmG [Methylococcales bacterium]